MDAIDILGGLLGRKAGGSGGSGGGLPDILKEILQSGTAAESRKPADTRATPTSPRSIEETARELEDLLNVTREREANRQGGQPQTRTQQPQQPQPRAEQPKAAPRRSETAPAAPADNPFAPTRTERAPARPQAGRPSQNDQALVLVRAMVNAAKSDGQITPDEQQSILQQFESGTPDAISFLRSELTRPLDVREFAWSVPIGMEQQVYSMSLVAIGDASNVESDYLQELAHGLRLSAEEREQLHGRFGARRRA